MKRKDRERPVPAAAETGEGPVQCCTCHYRGEKAEFFRLAPAAMCPVCHSRQVSGKQEVAADAVKDMPVEWTGRDDPVGEDSITDDE